MRVSQNGYSSRKVESRRNLVTCRLTLTSLTNWVDEMTISVLVDVKPGINIISLFRDNPVYAIVRTSSRVALI